MISERLCILIDCCSATQEDSLRDDKDSLAETDRKKEYNITLQVGEDEDEKKLYATLNNFRARTHWGAELSSERKSLLNSGAPWALSKKWEHTPSNENTRTAPMP